MHHNSSHYQSEVHSRDGRHSNAPLPPRECEHWSARTPVELREGGRGGEDTQVGGREGGEKIEKLR